VERDRAKHRRDFVPPCRNPWGGQGFIKDCEPTTPYIGRLPGTRDALVETVDTAMPDRNMPDPDGPDKGQAGWTGPILLAALPFVLFVALFLLDQVLR
jgi:hypothetical protein